LKIYNLVPINCSRSLFILRLSLIGYCQIKSFYRLTISCIIESTGEYHIKTHLQHNLPCPLFHLSDNEFLVRLTEIVEANLTNSQFGVSMLAKEMGMSSFLIHKDNTVISKK